jgi:hypothetical protein
MKITCDEAGKKAIDSLCDVTLKAGGVSNLTFVIEVLQSAIVEETKANTESDKKETK